mgnify:CR=1 FL=1
MREMKDSGIEWIGEIPTDWEVSTIKHEYAFQTGWTPDTTHEEYFIGENIWINISDMKSKVIYDSEKHISDEAVQLASMNISPKGSLLYAFKLSVGAVSFCGIDMYTNEAIATFLPGKNNLRFLYYMAPIFIIKNANENIYGAKLLNQKLIRNAKIVIPPLEVQERIADYLDRKCIHIDAIIARQQEVIEKLKAYKLSVITEAVTKGLNPDVPMKDSGVEWIGEIPEHWSIVPLTKQLESIVDYRGKTPEKVDDGIFLVTARNIKNGMIDYSISSEYVKAEDYDEIMRRGIPQIGDVLFTTEAPLGQVANVDRTDIALAQRIIKFSTKKHLDSYFLKYWIMSIDFQNFLMTLSTGSTAVGIKASKLFMLPVPLAPMQEQNQIVTYLDKKCKRIESVIDRKQALVDKFTDYKKSLIYEVVTGKKEV